MVDRVVFHVELANAEPGGQTVRLDERGESGMQARARLAVDRQELPVAPEVLGPLLDHLARHRAGNRRVVERDFERSETLRADPEGAGRVLGLAQVATEAEVHWCPWALVLESL